MSGWEALSAQLGPTAYEYAAPISLDPTSGDRLLCHIDVDVVRQGPAETMFTIPSKVPFLLAGFPSQEQLPPTTTEMLIASACTRVVSSTAWWTNWRNPNQGVRVGTKAPSAFPMEVHQRLARLRVLASALFQEYEGRATKGGQWDVVWLADGRLRFAECKVGTDTISLEQRCFLWAALSEGYEVDDFAIVKLREVRG